MADVTTMLGAIGDYFNPWQLLGLLVVIALIVFWVIYRRRQV